MATSEWCECICKLFMYVPNDYWQARGKNFFLFEITCHRLLDRTEIVKKCIDDFNNSIHLSMKASKKVVEIPID